MTDQNAPLPADKPCDDDTDDKIALIRAEAEKLNAEAEHIEAEAKLIEVKQPLYDRLVVRLLVPVCLAFAAPMATYYFAAKTDEGIQNVHELKEVGERLDVRMKTLDETLKTALIQLAVLQNLQQRASIAPVATSRGIPSTSETANRISEQFEIPGMSREQVRREAARILDRLEHQKK